MKVANIFWLVIIVLLLIATLFFFLTKSAGKPINTLGEFLSCSTEKIDQTILDLPADTTYLKAFISFQHLPLDETTQQKLTADNIYLDKNSQIFDYLWSTIPISGLCNLVTDDNVKSVFTMKQ